MNKDILTFCFKGNRTYVHGTDICSALNDYIAGHIGTDGVRNFDILFHKIIRKNLKLDVVKNADVTQKEHAAAIATFMKNDDRYVLLLSESDPEITCRTEYPEELITNACTVNAEGKNIALVKPLDFTIFEILIPMTKALHNSLFPDAKGKWFFTRLQTGRLLATKEQYKTIALKHLHNFKYKLTKNEITIDRETVGNIFFSLV
jgi:IS1 family transposase